MSKACSQISIVNTEDGKNGRGVTSITEQYYLSTSKESQVGGSWVDTPPAWESGKYLWTRRVVLYTDSTQPEYTEPVCDSSWEAINTKIPLIYGTQTSATYSWTGVAPFDELKDGQKITFWLPFASSGTTVSLPYWKDANGSTQQATNSGSALNLTLANGETTGNVACFYSGASRLATHFAAGNAIELTYRKLVKIGSYYYTGWWANANYYSDTKSSQIVYFGNMTGAVGIHSGGLFMEASDGTYQSVVQTRATGTKNRNTNGFKIGSNIYYTTTSYAAKAKISGNGVVYTMYGSVFDVRYTINDSVNALTAYKPWYLCGHVVDNEFFLDETWWTSTPSSKGTVYILIGGIYDWYNSTYHRGTLYENNPWYVYDGEKLVDYNKYQSDLAAQEATNYMTFESGVGLIVGNMTDETLGKNTLIDANGMAVRDGDTELARFGKDSVSLGSDALKLKYVVDNYGSTSSELTTRAESFWLGSGEGNLLMTNKTSQLTLGRYRVIGLRGNASHLNADDDEYETADIKIETDGDIHIQSDAQGGEEGGDIFITTESTSGKIILSCANDYGRDMELSLDKHGLTMTSTAVVEDTDEPSSITITTDGISCEYTDSLTGDVDTGSVSFFTLSKLGDSDWITPTFANNVSQSTAVTDTPVQYRKLNGVVYLSGHVAVDNFTPGTTLFTLPSGYRPATIQYYICATGGHRVARVYVTKTGYVKLEWIVDPEKSSSITGNIGWVSLASISFIADK